MDERWAAVQCLVGAGRYSAAVISELLCHFMDAHHPTKQLQAEILLKKISYKTVKTPSVVRTLITLHLSYLFFCLA